MLYVIRVREVPIVLAPRMTRLHEKIRKLHIQMVIITGFAKRVLRCFFCFASVAITNEHIHTFDRFRTSKVPPLRRTVYRARAHFKIKAFDICAAGIHHAYVSSARHAPTVFFSVDDLSPAPPPLPRPHSSRCTSCYSFRLLLSSIRLVLQ